jgi:hypothetical protein
VALEEVAEEIEVEAAVVFLVAEVMATIAVAVVVEVVAVLAAVIVTEVSQCTKLFALTAVKIAKFLSDLLVTNQFYVQNVLVAKEKLVTEVKEKNTTENLVENLILVQYNLQVLLKKI